MNKKSNKNFFGNSNKTTSFNQLKKKNLKLEANLELVQGEIKKHKAEIQEQITRNKLVQERNKKLSETIDKLSEKLLATGVSEEEVKNLTGDYQVHQDKKNNEFISEMSLEEEINFDKEKLRQDLLKKVNEEYMHKINEKAVQAEQILKEKIAQFQTKYEDELKQAKKYAFEKNAGNLVDIIQRFESVLSHTPEDPNLRNYLLGFKMFLSMFEQLLSDLSIQKLVAVEGDEFNPDTMEGFETEPVEESQVNKVISMIAPGYQLHDRVIKHIVVKVGVHKNN